MKSARALLLFGLLAWPGGAAADVFQVNMSTLPNPAGCANYQQISGGVADAACDEAIASERDPKAKSVMLFRRAFIEDASADFSKYPAALTDLDLAIKLFPQNWAALHERGYLYVEYGRWSDAVADLDSQIAINPKDPDGYRERALARFKLGNLQGAFDDRAAVIQAGTTLAGDYRALARAAMWLGKYDAASVDIGLAAKMAEQSPNDEKADDALRHAFALWTGNSGADAAKSCVMTDMPGPQEDKNLIGDCTSAYLEAKTPQDRSAALTTRSEGWLMLQHDTDSWVTDLEIAAALDPTNSGALSNLGYAYMRQQHSTAAAALFDRSIALKPEFYNYAGRAAARFNLHDYDGAERDALKSNTFRENELALTLLGDVSFTRTNTYDKARDFWIAAYRMGDRDDGLIDRLKKAGVPIPPPNSGGAP